jgi:hypothetical protein
MSMFEALYDRKCNTPVSWDNPADRVVIGPALLKDMKEQMEKINHNLKATQDMHKHYAEKNNVFRYFKVDEHVLLKVKAKRKLV